MLSLAQRMTVLAAVQADPTANGHRTAGDMFSLLAWLNTPGSVTVWKTNARVDDIIDSITWANYTPNDHADNTTTYLNRTLLSQIKQMNLQLMLQGRQTLDCSKANLRSGLRDAVIQLPTGSGGAMTTAGGASGATTLGVCTRAATRAEGILAAAAQTTGTVVAQILTFEGMVDTSDANWLVNN